MCGISGWFDSRGKRPADEALLRRMNDRIGHRGPDGDGFHFGEGFGFGHRRLAIIDLAGGVQPMFNEDGRICVTFNGEIYNFQGLREELIARGHRFATRSDTEVIVHGWEEWGPACLDRFQGMFAFALWDARTETMFLARDRMGEKPIYYATLADGSFIFASELKALLVHPGLERRIDPCAVEEFFALGYIAEPRTIYQGVARLEAGYCLTFPRGGAPKLRAYWDIGAGPERTENIDLLADELRDRLRSAVQAQLVADVPLGAFLSGGVDSSGVVALMAGLSTHPVNTFTVGFGDKRFDETRFAAEVAERYATHQTVERMEGDELPLIDRLPGMFDEPFGDSSALPTYLVAQLARRQVTVALSGDGGDELFAGYRRYRFHEREEALRGLIPSAVRRPVFAALGRAYPQMDWAPRFLRARHTFQELGLDSAEGYFANLSVIDDAGRDRLFSPSLRRELQGYRAADLIEHHMARAPSDDPLAIAQYIDIKTWLPSDILTKVDRTSMACSLEVRVPMLDHHFVEWAVRLPRAAKLQNGSGKAVLKQAMRPLLPDGFLDRPKQGFSVPLAAWFRGPLKSAFAAAVGGKKAGLAETGYFDMAEIGRLTAQHESGLHDHSRALWLLWMFQGFLSQTHGI
ncbi:MAG TPA: XrtA/PEP-CTERM system amidotransferase [Aliidongia sp.]|nr:XrtA/PEP-CTERM system amidotransferase [Aliidongia sp.]